MPERAEQTQVKGVLLPGEGKERNEIMAVIQRPQGGSKSLWLGSIKTGAGFRVNSRRIRKGGYPENEK